MRRFVLICFGYKRISMKVRALLVLFMAAGVLAACAPSAAPGHRVVYLTERANLPWDLLSPASLRSGLGAEATSEWGDVVARHAAAPLDGLVIDGPAAALIDSDELSRLYRQCVVIAFFNLYSPDVAALLQDPSIRQGGWMDGSQPYPGDFYIIVHREAAASQGDCTGAGPTGILGQGGGLGKSLSQHSLSSAADLNILLNVFMLRLQDRQRE